MAEEVTTAQPTEVAPVAVSADKPLQYLDKAVNVIRDLGIWPESQGEAPITGLLQKITELDETRVVLIGRTLSQASAFNEVVREQIAAMKIGERYEDITKGFDSIRDDAKSMVDQLADNRLDLLERASNVRMKVSRGDSTRSATPTCRSRPTPRTRSTASTRSSRPIAISAAH